MLRLTFRSAALGAVGASALCFALVTDATAQSSDSSHASVPDFSGFWSRARPLPSTFLLPLDENLPGPVWDPQDHAPGGVPWVGDVSNPILKPHAAQAISQRNDLILSGGEDLPPHSLCWPSGTPEVLNLREPVQILQDKDQITILYQRDHQIRRVFMDAAHSKNLEPSWYGESVGHYEGDTLVVTTISQNNRTEVDKFGTPHSENMRVVERYSLDPDGEGMTVMAMVEDPETFNMAWYARATYSRVPGPVEEIICAENNKNASTGLDYAVPIATGPADF
jgi:hypothetical protein